ncbi:MAG: bis-aminopropyl spermidine synthase family protein [Armatimonadota bacterium]|nr:bis-aminopropyl spermidine synthase family protein [Armatimonadota bacterium]MDW8026017.1 bis-aminopropyl spermidine synthase family protein [Armatimonadota bacterium]
MTLGYLHNELLKRLRVYVAPRDVERTLMALRSSDHIWEIVERSQVPMRVLCTLLELLNEHGLVDVFNGSIKLTELGERLCEENDIAPFTSALCKSCDGRTVDINALGSSVIEEFKRISSERPEAIQEYDQGFVTDETTLARVTFMLHRGDLHGKEIAVIGDDDLVSIACALTGKPKRVVALDIDERLISFIGSVRERYGLSNLSVVRHDLREPLPDWMVGAFDVFFTDPTESFIGFKVFVERGLQCLKGAGCSGYFGLTHVESSLNKWRNIQRFLLESGAVITDIVDMFNHYVNWGYIERMRSWCWLPVKVHPKGTWYKSSLYRIEWLEPIELPKVRYDGNIFEDEEAATT